MKAEASKVRQDFAAFLKIVGEGQEVVITKHGVDQAKFVPIADALPSDDDDVDAFCKISRLKADGVTLVNRMRARRRS